MATAGRPLRVTPISMRARSRLVQFGAAADKRVRSAEANSEATMTGLRPQTSDKEPATSIATARRPVESDRDRLLTAALTWNSCENSGSRGWTQ
jgi:hypothetical protein